MVLIESFLSFKSLEDHVEVNSRIFKGSNGPELDLTSRDSSNRLKLRKFRTIALIVPVP